MTKPMKQPPTINKKLIMLSFLFLFIVCVILKENISSFNPITTYYSSFLSTCNKFPQSFSESIVHYATSKITPQQTFEEISITLRVLEKKSPCNFLVFGIGYDSRMWASLNHGGRTVFLEGSMHWLMSIKRQMPSLEIYHVDYDSNVSQAKQLLDVGKSKACQLVSDPRLSECPLIVHGLPSVVYETEWDLIMVDGPDGYLTGSPGRMKAIYTAGLWAKNRRDGMTHVFVHDIRRPVENYFSKAFLCKAYITEETRLLRHFTIPTHRNGHRPFCPSIFFSDEILYSKKVLCLLF